MSSLEKILLRWCSTVRRLTKSWEATSRFDALDDVARDLQLLRGELHRRVRAGAAGRLAAGPQLGPGALRPAGRTERLEAGLRRTQVRAGVETAARTLWSGTPSRICEGLLDEVRRRAQGPLPDDATVVVAKFE